LTDLVCFKPAYIDSEDTRSYNLYFGELENNKRCYFAPERFCEPDFNKYKRDNNNLKKSMDIFSVACVISEIMMDGDPLFDRGLLIKYKTSNN
jgi:phosphoinositide-3-kinase regulatory subunit 4